VQIRNTQGTRLYAELVLSGYSAKPLPPRSEEISLSRSYFTPEGQPIGNRILKVGETVIVRIEAGSKAAIANGLVVDRVPAGLEIENRNLVQGESMASTRIGGRDPVEAMFDKRIQHVEYRDDRFVAAVRFDGETWRERDRMQLFYRAKVVTPGRFVVPPLHAEDMYRPEVFGLTGGSESITVVDPPPARK
jgi:alpha-2-macroglobulin